MTIKRSKGAAGRRLRLESLEDRAVPATAADTLPATPVDDPTKPVIIGDMPTDPAPGETMADGELDQTVIFQTMSDPPATDNSDAPVDLAATATIDKIKPSLGDVVTVTVTVRNDGDAPATGVALTALLPAGLAFVSATPGLGSGAYDSATGAWDVGTIGPDGSVALKIKAKVTDSAEQPVAAAITHSDQADPESANNSANLTVTPVLGAVTLTKTAHVSNPTVRSAIVLTLTVKNTGPGTARDIAVADTLGTGLAFMRALPPTRGTFAPSTKTWKITTLPAGTTATLQILAQVVTPGRIESPATMTATAIDETQSKLEANAVVTAVATPSPANWSYVTGPGFRQSPPILMPVRPGNGPIILPFPSTVGVAPILLARGLILPVPGV